eukprot:c28275_g1_i1 orf=3-224(-)
MEQMFFAVIGKHPTPLCNFIAILSIHTISQLFYHSKVQDMVDPYQFASSLSHSSSCYPCLLVIVNDTQQRIKIF